MPALLLSALLVASPATAAATAAASAPVPVSVAVQAATAAGDRVAVAVLDTDTGTFYGAGDVDGQFPSESVVKVLIAANLLATGQMTGATEQLAFQMITQSDDNAADSLWGTVGGPDVIGWAASYFHVTGLAAPSQWGWWGNTKVTARALVDLYAAIKANPTVGPWLIAAMSQMAPTAADGTDQDFGLAAQTTTGAFKQGWGTDDDTSNTTDLLSTGLLDGSRYAVAVLAQHAPEVPYATVTPAIDALAAAVAPGGVVAVPPPAVPPAPAPTPSAPTPSAATPSAPAPAASSALPPAATPARHDALPRTLRAAMTGGGLSLAGYTACLVALAVLNRRRISARQRGGRAGPAG